MILTKDSKKEKYIAPAIKEVLLTSINGVADGTPGMNNSVNAGDDDDKVKGEVIWGNATNDNSGSSLPNATPNLWDDEW